MIPENRVPVLNVPHLLNNLFTVVYWECFFQSSQIDVTDYFLCVCLLCCSAGFCGENEEFCIEVLCAECRKIEVFCAGSCKSDKHLFACFLSVITGCMPLLLVSSVGWRKVKASWQFLTNPFLNDCPHTAVGAGKSGWANPFHVYSHCSRGCGDCGRVVASTQLAKYQYL